MVQKMWRYACEHHMICKEDKVLVGCSGGADSVALLLALQEVQEKGGFFLGAVHVEHGIRGAESEQDQRFVEELCKEKNIPLTVARVDARAYAAAKCIGLEEAARQLRYEAFLDAARALGKNVKIALAHHLEDNAETVLFQLTRGSGIAGLCGIPMVRGEEDYTIIRPLLGCSREEIESYLKSRAQAFCVDSTNADEHYSRNRIRAQVLPQLSLVNPKAAEHINQSAAQLWQIWDYLEAETGIAYRRCFERTDCGYLDICALSKLHPAIRSGVVRRAIFEMTGQRKDILAVHVQEVLELMEKQTGTRINLPYGLSVTVSYGRLCLATDNEKEQEDEEYVVDEQLLDALQESGQTYVMKFGGSGETLTLRVAACEVSPENLIKKTYTKILDYDKIKIGFVVRKRRRGDYFIINEQGNRKKLKNYFIDEKIPAKERRGMYLLTAGSEVIWLIGGRISENYKITDTTKTMLIVEYNGGVADGLQ